MRQLKHALRTTGLMASLLIGLPATSSEAKPRERPALPGQRTVDLGEANITFAYWQYLEPFDKFACEHKPAATAYDWNVSCDVNGKKHEYVVHLVLHFYPRTNYGKSAYEILYWVTDNTNAASPAYDSSTIWVHNSTEENRMTALEVSQFVESDIAALRLTIAP